MISKRNYKFYAKKINSGHLLIGIKDFYIYDVKDKKLAFGEDMDPNDAHRMDETILQPLLDSYCLGLELNALLFQID